MKDFSEKIFKYRSYTPIPFLIVMFVFQMVTITSLIIGFSVSLLGEAIRLWGVCYAGSETRTTGTVGGTYLVISGAFAHVRNPLYLGNILIYLGIGIMSMALFPFLQIAALIFFYIQYVMIIDREERYLSESFGQNYKDYLTAVPKIIPRITPYKNEHIKQPELNIKAGFRSEKRSLQALTVVTTILIILYITINFVK